MKTAIIQIGNSDNKLRQNEWAEYVAEINGAIERHAYTTHFKGGSDWDAPWQNACWVIEIEDEDVVPVQQAMIDCRKKWRQDFVAVTVGETEFL